MKNIGIAKNTIKIGTIDNCTKSSVNDYELKHSKWRMICLKELKNAYFLLKYKQN